MLTITSELRQQARQRITSVHIVVIIIIIIICIFPFTVILIMFLRQKKRSISSVFTGRHSNHKNQQ